MQIKRFNRKILKIYSFLDAKNIDAVLLSDKNDIFYLTGYSNDYSALLITKRDSIFFTDYTFFHDAMDYLKRIKVRCLTNILMEEVGQLLIRMKVKKLGVDPESISYKDYLVLKSGRPNIEVLPIKNLVNVFRATKDRKELIELTSILDKAEATFLKFVSGLKPGKTEIDAAKLLDQEIRSVCDDIAFPSLILSGLNSAKPHASVTQKKIEKGELVVIDFGGKKNGYHSDCTRTVIFSKPTAMQKKVYNTVLKMMDYAVNMIKPGGSVARIAEKVRKIAEDSGYRDGFLYPLGHGIGLSLHENPFLSENSEDIFEENNVICIEPGIFIPGWGGIRIENTIVIKKSGAEILNKLDYNQIWIL